MANLIVIPNAEVFITTQKEKEMAQQKEASRAHDKHLNKLHCATNEFVADMTKRFVDRINAIRNSSSHFYDYVELRFDKLPTYQGVPGDILLYGHRLGMWYKRRPLENSIRPFEELQLSFFVAGWYLIEVSDPNKSFAIIFRLYPQQPPETEKDLLWHNHYFVDKDKMSCRLGRNLD